MTDRPEPNERLVKVFDTEHESEALVVKALLDSFGIDADLTSTDAAQETFPGVGGAIILVREEDAERARQVIAESQASASEIEEDAEVPGAMETEMGRIGDIVRGIYDAFGRGDVSSVLGALDAGIRWNEAENFLYADGNPYVGPQAVAEGVFQRIASDVEGFTVVSEHFVEGGDTVVVEGRYRGTMKATRTRVDAQFAHVWRLRDGKVVRFQQYTDTRQWAHAAGR